MGWWFHSNLACIIFFPPIICILSLWLHLKYLQLQVCAKFLESDELSCASCTSAAKLSVCVRRLWSSFWFLQNDLKELWSLLNLLLPEVFDNRKAFHDWFSKPFQKDGASESVEDDWLETEKKVIIIHRLHQILEPFMLRRRLEDVEGSLPPKVILFSPNVHFKQVYVCCLVHHIF